MRRNVYLAQVNNRFGNAIFLPYSVGLLQAYAQQFQDINDRYDFCGFLVVRDPIPVALDYMRSRGAPDVLGLSCYIWNFEYNCALAAAVKAEWPDCLTVAGGPHIPEDVPNDWWEHRPYFDVLVHHEAEETFAAILRDPEAAVGLTGIKGAIPGTTNRHFTVAGYERVKDLERIPSPYLTGLFDKLILELDMHGTELVMSQETNRGCPYQCHFCDWGSAVFTKVRKFPEERVVCEYAWAADHRVDLVYNCDANYGLFERDLALTRELAATKHQFGYPRQFRAAYAKNSNERVFEIARVLNDAEMNKGITLSFQSLEPSVLSTIKRKNMAMNDFSGLTRQYADAKIATYTEMILGLPNETYETFVNGICTLLDNGQHDSINIYPCMILPNAEMARADYRDVHNIRSVVIPDLATHSVPADDPYTEYKEIVIATATMPLGRWRDAYIFGAFVQAFHSMGLLQLVAKHLDADVGYHDFYEWLAHEPHEATEDAYGIANDATHRVVGGGPWDVVLPDCGPITWTPEEAMFLGYVLPRRHRALLEAVGAEYGVPQEVLDAQYAAVWHPGDGPWATLEDYAREVVWYGRKASKWRRHG